MKSAVKSAVTSAMKYLTILGLVLTGAVAAEARIRLRKVKEAPRVCQNLKEDRLLSRPGKKVLSTERHSLVFEDSVSLIKDKGEKICDWPLAGLDKYGSLDHFNFYIDEYKEVLYSYIQNEDRSYTVVTTPLQSCSLEKVSTVVQFEQPKCEKPQKASKKRKKKKARPT